MTITTVTSMLAVASLALCAYLWYLRNSLHRNNQELHQANNALHLELDSLNCQVLTQNSAIKTLNDHIKSLENVITLLNEQVRVLQDELNRAAILNNEVQTLNEQKGVLEDEKSYLNEQVRILQEDLNQAVQRLAAKSDKHPESSDTLLDKTVKGLVALGIPGLILLVAMATTGFAGAAAITTALAALGGPFGMLGGIGVLLLLSLTVSKAIESFGMEQIASLVIKGLIDKGNDIETIRNKIKSYPIPAAIRMKLESLLDQMA